MKVRFSGEEPRTDESYAARSELGCSQFFFDSSRIGIECQMREAKTGMIVPLSTPGDDAILDSTAY